jgi:hypothetical protein
MRTRRNNIAVLINFFFWTGFQVLQSQHSCCLVLLQIRNKKFQKKFE